MAQFFGIELNKKSFQLQTKVLCFLKDAHAQRILISLSEVFEFGGSFALEITFYSNPI